MSTTATRPRIAVLGGGLGSLSALWYLTCRPDWQEHYEIDVYQLGWRLGGKGACGRNPDIADRIEEHGLHILFGFYDNGLALLRSLYSELGRDPGAPMATFEEAFTGHDLITLTDEYAPEEDRWWSFRMPPIPSREDRSLDALLAGRVRGALGLRPDELSDRRGLPAVISGVLALLRDLFSLSDLRSVARSTLQQRGSGGLNPAPLLSALARLGIDLVSLDTLGENPLGELLGRIRVRGEPLYHDDPEIPDLQETLADALAVVLSVVNQMLQVSWETTALRRPLMLASLGLSGLCGILRSMKNLWAPDWFALDSVTFEDWLISHGCEPRTAWSCLTRVLRQVGFAEKHGAGAGTTLHWAMRMVLDYQGHFMYKMNAGMGDVIFVPFYRVLQRRGVRFHFFHRIDAVHHDGHGNIHQIEVGRPVTVKAGSDAYAPLITVKGLECWPDRPLFDQLEEGDDLRRCWAQAPVDMDLENWWTAWRDRQEPRILRKGHDFDHVILGISVAALPEICKDLCEDKNNPAFGEMVRSVVTIQTRSFQLWLKADTAGLGYTAGRDIDPDGWSPVLGTYPARFDTWSDTTLVEPWESWPAGEVQHVAYWCAGMTDEEGLFPLPPRGPSRYLHRQMDRCFASLVEWAGYHVLPVWPLAAEPDLPTLVNDGEGDDEAEKVRGTLYSEAAVLSNQTDGGGPRALPPQRSLKLDLLATILPTPPSGGGKPCADATPAIPDGDDLSARLARLAAAPALAALRGQYWRVPYYPSERYVLSVPGSVQKRLAPWESGYTNLFLVGDWTLSPISAGCVEATVQSAAMCAQALAGTPERIEGYWLQKQPPPPAISLPPQGREEPSLIPALVNPLPAPPYEAHQARVQTFVIRADLAVLQQVCDRMLNLPGSPVVFRPVGPFVMFVAAHIHRFDTAQPEANTPESDFGIWIPVYQGHIDPADGSFAVNSVAFFLPALWVDPPLAITAGREIFGYQKSEGRLSGPQSPNDPQRWRIEGFVVPRFGPYTAHTPTNSSGYRWAPVLEVHHSAPDTTTPPPWERLGRLSRRLLDRLRPTTTPTTATLDEAFLQTLLDALRGLQIPMVYLKQFPSIANAQRACYQAVCRSLHTVMGDLVVHRIPGPHTLTLHAYASCDLASALGISVDSHGQTPVLTALQLEFSFRVNLGEVLHDVRNPG